MTLLLTLTLALKLIYVDDVAICADRTENTVPDLYVQPLLH
jgi:hypothetical protein